MSEFLAKPKKAVIFNFKLCADFYWTPLDDRSLSHPWTTGRYLDNDLQACIIFISRTAGRNVSRFPSPICMCPASGFSLTSRPGQERCLQSCSKNGDRLRATRTLFLQGVRELQ